MINQDCLSIGKLVKTHGIHGELIAETSEPELFKNIKESVLLEINGLPVPFFLESKQQTSTNRFRLKFLWTDSSDKAQHLVNSDIYIPKSNIKSDFTPNAPNVLIGFKAIDQDSNLIGEISNFYEHEKNPLLSIKIDRKEVLIPFHPDIISSVDINQKTVHINLPDGLIDIYL